MKANQLGANFTAEPKKVARELANALKDFGYSVTDDWVEQEVRRLLAGGTPTSGPSVFLNRWLTEEVE